MSDFETYRDSYRFAHLKRRNGILEVALHTDGGPMRWSLEVQKELVRLFTDIGADRGNRLIILTGTGEEFSGPVTDPNESVFAKDGRALHADDLDAVWWSAKRLVTRLLDIDVPMIAAVNGPAKRHSEIALLCDIVLASDDATFEDTAHFHLGGHVPGDGVNTVYTLLLGINRARYFMLTGQVLSAVEAKEAGLVGEVLAKDELMPRAWALAEQIAEKPDLVLRYTRILMVDPLRKILEEKMQYFLTAEALGLLAHAPKSSTEEDDA